MASGLSVRQAAGQPDIALRATDGRRLAHAPSPAEQVLAGRKQPLNRGALAAAVAAWCGRRWADDRRREARQRQARKNGDLRVGMFQWPSAQRSLIHLGLAMRF